MTSLTAPDQLAELRDVVFAATSNWNVAHPHPLRSHQERASVHVTQVYNDANSSASYTISIECGLAGTGHLTFHGHDLAAVAEHARLTLEHRISVEVQRRADKAQDDDFDRKYGIAV